MNDGDDVEVLERPKRKAPELGSGEDLMAEEAERNTREPVAEQPQARASLESHHIPTSVDQEGSLSVAWAGIILTAGLATIGAIFGAYQATSSQSEKLVGLISEVSNNQITSSGELDKLIAINSTVISNLEKSIDSLRSEQKESTAAIIADNKESTAAIIADNNEAISLLRKETGDSINQTNRLLSETVNEIKALSGVVGNLAAQLEQ